MAVDVRAVVGDLDFSKRQLVEIARACLAPQEVLGIAAGVVLLDEPTASLQKEEERAFFDMVASLREHASVLFVSHRLSEVLAVSDRLYVLKDGRLVADLPTEGTSERRLHALMVGRERDADYYHEGRQQTVDREPAVFAAEGLTRRGHFIDVSFAVRQRRDPGDRRSAALGQGDARQGAVGRRCRAMPGESGSARSRDRPRSSA